MLIRKLARPKYLFLLLLALSVAFKVGVSLLLIPLKTEPSLLDQDEQEYYFYAGDLLKGHYEFNSRRTLGHILILAIFRLITFDNFQATQLLTTVIFSFTAPLTYLLVRRITGHNLLAVVVSVLTIVWPPYIYYGRSLYSETTALPIFTSLLILLPKGSILQKNQSEGNWRHWGLCGVLLGLCMLIRPMYLLFIPFVLLIVFLEELQWLKALKRTIFLFGGCFLVVLPWSIYMTTNAGVPIIISANGGETIAGGFNPTLIQKGYQSVSAPDGRMTWEGPGKWIPLHRTGYLSEEELKLPYPQQDTLLKQRSLAWVFQHPGSALYLQGAKLLYMWGFYPLQVDKQTLLGSIPTVIALILSIISLVRFREYVRHLVRFWTLPIFVSGVALISWGSWRFRQPGDLGILTLSSLLVLSLLFPSLEVLPKKDRGQEAGDRRKKRQFLPSAKRV
ncbi:ArnT family glycosyltransferase [Aliinostoc sp. HNIBRCY26]|uniref:ArnT family glycosyltransferase n=1 Tax=Aliinostoc sp. HNIBRCY26 TaxID=3418997 RepID=UPI003D063DC2